MTDRSLTLTFMYVLHSTAFDKKARLPELTLSSYVYSEATMITVLSGAIWKRSNALSATAARP